MSTYSSKDEALARVRRGPAPVVEVDRYDVSGIGPDEFDGGAYAYASHAIIDGAEVECPHLAYVAAVAQPAEVRALRRRSVMWHGGTGRIEDPDAGALADTARSTRETTRALVGPDGCNLTRVAADGTTTRERWNHVSRDAALWLHAVAGTNAPANVHSAPEARSVVGAVRGMPRRIRTRHGVALDYVSGSEVRTYVRSRPLTSGGRWDAPADVVAGALPHTARSVVLGREDERTGAERRAADPTRAERDRSRQAAKREIKARLMAVQALQTGAVVGRADAAHVRLARGAVVVALLSGGAVTPLDLVQV